jgi:hypothetical protein
MIGPDLVLDDDEAYKRTMKSSRHRTRRGLGRFSIALLALVPCACSKATTAAPARSAHGVAGLPTCGESRGFEHDDRVAEPVLRLSADGVAEGWTTETPWGEASLDDYTREELTQDGRLLWLADLAKRSYRKLDREAGVMLPQGRLLILADADAACGDVAAVLAFCGQRGIGLWRFALGVRSTRGEELALIVLEQMPERQPAADGFTLSIEQGGDGVRITSGDRSSSDARDALTWFPLDGGPVDVVADPDVPWGSVLAVIESAGLAGRFQLAPGE